MKRIVQRLSLVLLVAVMVITGAIAAFGSTYHTAADAQATGSLTIHKYRYDVPDTGAITDGDGVHNGSDGQTIDLLVYEPVAGVKYHIYQTHSFTVTNGVITTITAVTGGADLGATSATNEAGEFTIPDLPLGRYTFQEWTLAEYTTAGLTPPAGIEPNTATYTFEVPMTVAGAAADGTTGYNFEVHAYPKNDIKTGSVTLNKTQLDSSTGTSSALSGATFELYAATVTDGVYAATGTALEVAGVSQWTTSETGLISIVGLDVNKPYVFKETGTGDTSLLPITDTSQLGFIINNADNTATINLENRSVEKDIKLLDGSLSSVATDGTAHISVLEDFTYEIFVPVPSDIDNYTAFQVVDDASATTGAIIKSVSISSVAYPGGAETAVSDITLPTLTDTSTGFTIDHLAGFQLHDGEVLKLTVTAQFPTGRSTQVVNTATASGTVGDQSPSASSTATATPVSGAVTITKLDAETNAAILTGAEFKLQRLTGTDTWTDVPVVEFTTSATAGTAPSYLTSTTDGTLTWSGLPLGTYRVVETKAPTYTDTDGTTQKYYVITVPETVIPQLVLASDNTVPTQTANIDNYKPKWYLPFTGGMGALIYTIVGVAIVAAGVVLLVIRRKRKLEAHN